MWPKTTIIHTWQLCALNAPKVCYIKSKSISNEQTRERKGKWGIGRNGNQQTQQLLAL